MTKVGIAEKDFMVYSTDYVIQPLRCSLDEEMKSITKERKILETKRLDLDASRARLKKADTADKMSQCGTDLRQAQEEYNRQYEVTKLLLEGINKTQQKQKTLVQSFVNALGEYHTQCQQYLSQLQTELQMSTELSETTETTSTFNGAASTPPTSDL